MHIDYPYDPFSPIYPSIPRRINPNNPNYPFPDISPFPWEKTSTQYIVNEVKEEEFKKVKVEGGYKYKINLAGFKKEEISLKLIGENTLNIFAAAKSEDNSWSNSKDITLDITELKFVSASFLDGILSIIFKFDKQKEKTLPID